MPTRRRLVRGAALLAALLAFACDEGTPVSPVGTLLRISANPTRIGTTGTATITIQALRSNGNPVNPGTEVRLSTSIGTIDSVVHTDNDGVAHATLRGDGRAGTATISAYSGAVDPVTTDVAVGVAAGSVRLSASPTSIPESGGTINLVARVRDDQGQPVAGAIVNFLTDVGTLDSDGAFMSSDANGEARDVLTVTELDVQTVGGDTFDVTAEASGTGGVQSDSVSIGIQRPPEASFTFVINNLSVAFTDTSTGNPTSWHWDSALGEGFNQTSTQQNPVFTYPGPGTYLVRLQVRNAAGSSEISQNISLQ